MQKMLNDEVRISKSKVSLYQESHSDIEEELKKNKMAQKLNKFGADFALPIAENVCATCHNPLDDSLALPENMLMNMTIDENIKYLENQKSMINSLIAGLLKDLERSKSNVLLINGELQDRTRNLVSLKRDIKSVASTGEFEIRLKLTAERNIEQLTYVKQVIDKELKD